MSHLQEDSKKLDVSVSGQNERMVHVSELPDESIVGIVDKQSSERENKNTTLLVIESEGKSFEDIPKDANHLSKEVSDKTENSVVINDKSEKKRTVLLARKKPPELIHYLQDKESPKVDDDNSPPQLLPEVIVTRKKLHNKEKSASEESTFKSSLTKNIQRIKRKSWSKHSYCSSSSDDQTSNEAHDHCSWFSLSEGSLTSLNCEDVVTKLLNGQKKLKTNQKEKQHKLGSPQCSATLESFTFSAHYPESPNFLQRYTEYDHKKGTGMNPSGTELPDSIPEIKSELDSWLTETEEEDDDDDDIFITPQRVSTGKEERDTIDGIEFLAFETEHDMIEFTKIELDFQGTIVNEDNITCSDDGLYMMDDVPYTYIESEAQVQTQAIIPTKTKDITKIKGWRTKNFAVNNNPSDGQGGSNSVSPCDDDDGFVSCDIKIEEDTSLDIEEHRDLWYTDDQDLFTHDDELPLSHTNPLEEFQNPTQKDNKVTCEEFGFRQNEEIPKEETMNISEEEKSDTETGNIESTRYPKRSTAVKSNFVSTGIKPDEYLKTIVNLPHKEIQTRGRKPKTLAEKRLMLQLANQYKNKRKRGKPKGSAKPSTYQKSMGDKLLLGNAYNLRNASKLDMQTDLCAGNRHPSMLLRSRGERQKRETFKRELRNRSTLTGRIKMAKIEATLDALDLSEEEKSLNEAVEHSVILEEQKEAPTFPEEKELPLTDNCKKVESGQDETCVSKEQGDPSTEGNVMLEEELGLIVNSFKEDKCISKSKTDHNNENNTSIEESNQSSVAEERDKPSPEGFNYGLVVSTCITRPLVTLAVEQLALMRNVNTHIDEDWAKFSASMVLPDNWETVLPQQNTFTLPVCSHKLPFTSFSSITPAPSKPVPTTDSLQNKLSSLAAQQCNKPNSSSIYRKYRKLILNPLSSTVPFNNHHTMSSAPLTQQATNYTCKKISKVKTSLMTKTKNINKVMKPIKKSVESVSLLHNTIDNEVKRVIEDLVDYIDRQDAKDLVMHEEPYTRAPVSDNPLPPENLILKKKKQSMFRELSRLDVSVIEMWESKNITCTQEHCRLGCVCESLETCRPPTADHCGKEECMFFCECGEQTFQRNSNKQHTLLSPLTLLNIPQQNRRVLAKEEKEFHQTVIKAKNETIVVGSGTARRKREIKLPGRFRDSYVALGKEYGLVDFKISSDETQNSPTKRASKGTTCKEMNNPPTQQVSLLGSAAFKRNIIQEMKKRFIVKDCSVKLRIISEGELKQWCKSQREGEHKSDYENDNEQTTLLESEEDVHLTGIASLEPDNREQFHHSPKQCKKSRNMAVKSTTSLSHKRHNPFLHCARTVPVSGLYTKKNILRAQQDKLPDSEHEGDSNEFSNQLQSFLIPQVVQNSLFTSPAQSVSSSVNLSSGSEIQDFVLSGDSDSFGKIESVTTLSEEQFQKGELAVAVNYNTQEKDIIVLPGREDQPVSKASEKPTKGKSANLSITKIAALLNRKIYELKSGAQNAPNTSVNEESIHLLQWPVMKKLFREKSIQLWYTCGPNSKLVITSTKIRPGSSFVNLNDIPPHDYRQLPPLVSDLLSKKDFVSQEVIAKRQVSNPDVYALLHFDGRLVELVGTIYKNKGGSETDNPCFGKLKFADKNQTSVMTVISETKDKCKNNIHWKIDLPRECPDEAKKLKDGTPKEEEKLETEEEPLQAGPSTKEVTSSSRKNKSQDNMLKEKEMTETGKPLTHLAHSAKEVISVASKNSSLRDNVPETQIRKCRAVLHSTMLDGKESTFIPLPACLFPSRWYVLHIYKPFDVMHITSRKCIVKYRHLLESVKMAIKHRKTVRLPLVRTGLSAGSAGTVQQPRFGVYAIPDVTSYVFVGPYGLSEDNGIVIYIPRTKKLSHSLQDTSSEVNANVNENLFSKEQDDVQEVPQGLNAVLLRLCTEYGSGQRLGGWIYTTVTRKSLSNETNKSLEFMGVGSSQEEDLRKKGLGSIQNGNPKEDKCSLSSNKNTIPLPNLSLLCSEKFPEDQASGEMSSCSQSSTTLNKPCVKKKKYLPKSCLPEKINGSEEKGPGHSLSKSTSKVTSTDITNKTLPLIIDAFEQNLSFPKHTQSVMSVGAPDTPVNNNTAIPSVPFIVIPPAPVTATTAVSQPGPSNGPIPSLIPVASTAGSNNKFPFKTILPKPFSNVAASVHGRLIPSILHLGYLPVMCNLSGGIVLNDPLTGMKQTCENLQAAQQFLDNLLRSTILFIPRHLELTWRLVKNVDDDGVRPFDSDVLNGGHVITIKGAYDIDEMIATQADVYGLRPIEVLRLQDKKTRRDLELGFFQLKQALKDCGHKSFSSKLNLLIKAGEEILNLKTEFKESDKQRKKWRSIKQNSLLKLYNMMKGLPIEEKRAIVTSLKAQYDETEVVPLVDVEFENSSDYSASTYSMSRYCGSGKSIFGTPDADSDLEDYTSEYEEESEDGLDLPELHRDTDTNNVNSKKTVDIFPLSEKAAMSGRVNNADDDESVSISLVSASTTEEKCQESPANADDVTVTCLNDSRGTNSVPAKVLLKQNESGKKNSLPGNTSGRANSVKQDASSVCVISQKAPVIHSLCDSNSSNTEHTKIGLNSRGSKRKLSQIINPSSDELQSKKLRPFVKTVQSLQTLSDRNKINCSVAMKQNTKVLKPTCYKTIQISNKDSLALRRSFLDKSAPSQFPVQSLSTKSPSGTMFVVTPSCVENSKVGRIQPLNTSANTSANTRLATAAPTIKVVYNSSKPMFVKSSHGRIPVLLAQPCTTSSMATPTTIVGKQFVTTSASTTAAPPKSVKMMVTPSSSEEKDSPQPQFLPTLLPIVDGKVKTQTEQQNVQSSKISLSSMPTLIPIVGGKALLPVDVDKKSTS